MKRGSTSDVGETKVGKVNGNAEGCRMRRQVRCLATLMSEKQREGFFFQYANENMRGLEFGKVLAQQRVSVWMSGLCL